MLSFSIQQVIGDAPPSAGAPLPPALPALCALSDAQLAALTARLLHAVRDSLASGASPFLPALPRNDGGRSFARGEFRSPDAGASALAHLDNLAAEAQAAAGTRAGAELPGDVNEAQADATTCVARLLALRPLLAQRRCLPKLAASMLVCEGQVNGQTGTSWVPAAARLAPLTCMHAVA